MKLTAEDRHAHLLSASGSSASVDHGVAHQMQHWQSGLRKGKGVGDTRDRTFRGGASGGCKNTGGVVRGSGGCHLRRAPGGRNHRVG